MKKKFTYFVAAVCAALTFSACSSDKLEAYSGQTLENPESPSNAISFGTYMGKTGTTRATGGATGDITTTVLKGDTYGFGVVAYHTNTVDWAGASNTVIPNFMWNQKVTWDTSNLYWTYSPVKYWPNDFSTGSVDHKEGTDQGKEAWGSQNGGKVSFFAYAPYVDFPATSSGSTAKHDKTNVSEKDSPDADGIVAMTANDATGEPEVYYVLGAADMTKAVDLLWGVRGNSSGYQKADASTDATSVGDYNVNLTKQSVSENVNFLFKHALAKAGGHTATGTPAGLQTGLQIVLDVDNGSLATGEKEATAITGGVEGTGTLVTVEEIDILDKATASAAPYSLYASAQTSDLVKAGWFNIATGTWNLGTPVTGATYSSVVTNTSAIDPNKFALRTNIKEGTPTAVTTGTPATFSKWQINSTDVTGVTTAVQDVYTDDSNVPGLVLIPSTTDQTLVVRIKYIVRTYDANLANGANDDTGSSTPWTKVTQTITNEVKIPGGALKSNKYYKLLIHLGLTSVKFSASVVDWEESAGSSTSGTDNDDPNYDKDVYLPSNTLATTSVATTETVSNATVAAGASKTYSVPAAAGTFTVSLTGIDTNNTTATVTAVATGADAAVVPTVTYTNAETSGTVAIALTENSSTAETRTTTLTIKTKDSGDNDVTTTVTLVQVPAGS